MRIHLQRYREKMARPGKRSAEEEIHSGRDWSGESQARLLARVSSVRRVSFAPTSAAESRSQWSAIRPHYVPCGA